ncbi:MAG: TonB C-terminal domain-containing protein [Betaproteobacteria bacterium]
MTQSITVLDANVPLKMNLWTKSFLIALALSIGVHVVLLFMRKNEEDLKEKHTKAPMLVVLVNSKSNLAPQAPKKLAQYDLNGGGQEADAIVASALAESNPQISQRLESLEKEQTRLLALLRKKQANPLDASIGKSEQSLKDQDPLEAELAKRLIRESQRPRKAIFTSTSAKAVVYAEYYDLMKTKVEKYGTTYFPRRDNQPLYGNLVIMVSVNSLGKIMAIPQIERSSGNADLDRQAIAIVNASGPFGPFPSKMARQIDVIDWIATFDFVQGQGNKIQLELNMTKDKP